MVESNQVPVEIPAEAQELQDEVGIAQRKLTSLNPGDESYLSALGDLAERLMSRFVLSRNPDDLDECISRGEQFLALCPPGHHLRLAAQSNLGGTLNRRFKLRGDANDLTQAINCFEATLEACAPGESSYVQLVANFASCLLTRYRSYGDAKDLDRIIEIGSTALSASPAESPNRDALLNNLGNALKERFVQQGNKTDLDEALSRYQSCLDLRPAGHPLRHSVLENLADALFLKSKADDLQGLENAANHYVSALELLSPGQDGYLSSLTGLADVYMYSFSVQGDVKKMNMAIGCYEMAMEHSTVPNLNQSQLLDDYGGALRTRFTTLGNIDDLDRAIQYLTTSSVIQPLTYPGRPVTLLVLGTSLVTRFNVTGNITDLDSSVENLASALHLCGLRHQQRPTILSMYAYSLSTRFKAKGNVEDLNLTISTCKEALARSSPEEASYSSNVANLVFTLLDCFRVSGNIEDCQTVIDHCDRALAFAQSSGPAFIPLKISRAEAFLHIFQSGREETVIQSSIDTYREIIPMLYEGHAEYVAVHLQLGIALTTRFQLSSDIKDIDESIAHYRIAHGHSRRGDSNYIPVCMQLGNALRERSDNDADSRDALDEAVVLLTEAEDILSSTPGQIDYKAVLVALGSALFMRFQSQRNKDDLDAAIERMSCALTLPAMSEEFLVSFNLATLFSVHYDEYRNVEDLERSVELFGVASEGMPLEHLSRGILCRHYGHVLFKLGCQRDHLQHLDAAVVFYKEALEHISPSHISAPMTNMRLAEAIFERAKLLQDSDGGNEALRILQDVLKTLPKDNPDIYAVSYAAAKLTFDIYQETRESCILEDSFRCYEQAAHYTKTRSFESVLAALEWAAIADDQRHSSALLAYQTALGSLNQHLLGTASIKDRRAALLNKHLIGKKATLATDATACAIGKGELGLAVELSEQGRGLLWSQMSRSRTPLDTLRLAGEVGRALASDFERLSALLAQSTFEEHGIHSSMHPSRRTIEEATRRHRQWSKELDNTIGRIRQQPGLESFLDRPSFESLRCAAEGGPVILINVSRQRCDAVIVLHDAPPRLVPLPNATLDDLTELSAHLYQMLKGTKRVGDEKTRERQLVVVLRTLWDCIVCPVVDELVTFLPRGSRIWWCPTSKVTTLPLHAAGPYRKGTLNLPNVYISSYTPTLAALVRARQPLSPSLSSTASSPPSPPSFLAVGQAAPASSTSQQLHTVSVELDLVRSLVPASMRFESLSDEVSTAEATLQALGTHAWAHLACHGRPNIEQPFDSAFELRDRAMTVLDVARVRGGVGIGGHGGHDGDGDRNRNADGGNDRNKERSKDEDTVKDTNVSTAATAAPTTTPGEFVFLSACHTAVGDAHAPDEIVHLAAAMQFAGFRSVIGTMWAVDDSMAMAMVDAFYSSMSVRDANSGGGKGAVNGKSGGGEGTHASEKTNGPDENEKAASQSQAWDCTQAARALNRACKLVNKDAVSIDQRVVFIHIGA